MRTRNQLSKGKDQACGLCKGTRSHRSDGLARPERNAEPVLEDGWLRVRITHASLNRHDVFTLRGLVTEKPVPYPMIFGNDVAGLFDDGTPVVIYPVMGSNEWKADETIDPDWYIFSELVCHK